MFAFGKRVRTSLKYSKELIFSLSQFCQSESHVFALFFSEVLRHTLDIKETFDYAHGKFDSCLVVEPGFFEAAVYMSPAIGRSSTSCDYPVEFVCAVREMNALEAFENFLRVHGVFRFREIVDGVGIRAIAEHGPDDAAVSFTETFFGQAGRRKDFD